MNKLEIIQEVLGNNYTPIVSCHSTIDFYYAKPKCRGWISSYDLKAIIENARLHNARVAIDLQYKQIDFFFNDINN
jgi:hypothetical protein